MDMVASVVINGCSLIFVTRSPFSRPNSRPPAMVMGRIAPKGRPSRARIAASTPENAATAPADSSIMPAIIR